MVIFNSYFDITRGYTPKSNTISWTMRSRKIQTYASICGPLGVLGSTLGGCNAHRAKLPKFCEFLRTSSSTACESWSAAVAVVFFRDFMGFFRVKHGEKNGISMRLNGLHWPEIPVSCHIGMTPPIRKTISGWWWLTHLEKWWSSSMGLGLSHIWNGK